MFRSRHDVSRCALVGVPACTASRRNATTAWSKTSTGRTIAVTYCSDRPPYLSHFFVNSPGIEPAEKFLCPKVICQDADLVVLRVVLDTRPEQELRDIDDFVYRVDLERPRLDLLPKPPSGKAFGRNEIAVLSCCNGDAFVVAALQVRPAFTLHLYRSSTDGRQGTWTSRVLSVEQRVRDVVPFIPGKSLGRVYHLSTKAITIGGDEGLVGWVDLWQGILLCDVLSPDPKLRDVPLPPPAMGNRKSYLKGCPSFSRDITVNKARDTISYVEMEIKPPREVCKVQSGDYYEEEGLPDSVIPGRWTTTTWRMPVRAAASSSSHKWHRHRTVHLSSISLPDVGNEKLCRLLDLLLSTSRSKEKQDEATGATCPSLGGLFMAYPALSMDDDDVVHFSTRGTCMGRMGSMEAVVSVDLRAKALLGLAVLDTKRYRVFTRSFVASGISIDLKTGGPRPQICPELLKAIKALRMEGAENGRQGVCTQ